MIITLLIWSLIFAESLAIGTAIARFLGEKNPSFDLTTILLGLAGIGVIAQFLSLTMPINLFSFLIIFGVSLVSAFIQRPSFVKINPRIFKPTISWLPYLLILAFSIAMAVRDISNPDTNIYHAQAIRWIETYRAVPGLGNLYGRLAFNSAWFVLQSAYSFAFLGGNSFHLLNSFLFLSFGFSILHSLPKKDSPNTLAKSAAGVLLLVFSGAYLASDLSSPGTDTPAAITCWWLAWSLLNIGEESRHPAKLVALAVLAVFAVTVKLSAAPILLLPALVIGLFFYKDRLVAMRCALACTFILLPFLARNLILSGYLIYPFPSIDLFTFSWKVPLARVIEERDGVMAFGRLPGEPITQVIRMPIQEWLPLWFTNLTTARKALVIAAISSILTLPLVIRVKQNGKILPLGLSLYWIGTIFWLLTSPDLRFGYSFLVPAIIFLIYSLLHNNHGRFSYLKQTQLLLLVLYFSLLLIRSGSIGLILANLWSPPDYDRVGAVECKIGNSTVFCSKQYSACSYHNFPCIPHERNWVFMAGSSPDNGYYGTK